jgi:hypothetical protein
LGNGQVFFIIADISQQIFYVKRACFSPYGYAIIQFAGSVRTVL